MLQSINNMEEKNQKTSTQPINNSETVWLDVTYCGVKAELAAVKVSTMGHMYIKQLSAPMSVKQTAE
jgi:hypothetical protein